MLHRSWVKTLDAAVIVCDICSHCGSNKQSNVGSGEQHALSWPRPEICPEAEAGAVTAGQGFAAPP